MLSQTPIRATAATSKKAIRKGSVAEPPGDMASSPMRQAIAPSATPSPMASWKATENSVFGRRHRFLRDVGEGNRVQRRELHRARHAAHEQDRADDRQRHVLCNRCAGGDRSSVDETVDYQHLPEPEAPQHRGSQWLHDQIAGEYRHHHQAGIKGIIAEADLEHHRQQERDGAHTHSKQRTAPDRGGESRYPERGKIDHRMRRSLQMAHGEAQ